MRFLLAITFLAFNLPSAAQDTFKLRIENLKCHAFQYDTIGFQLNHDATKEPLTDLIKIKDNKEEYLQLCMGRLAKS